MENKLSLTHYYDCFIQCISSHDAVLLLIATIALGALGGGIYFAYRYIYDETESIRSKPFIHNFRTLIACSLLGVAGACCISLIVKVTGSFKLNLLAQDASDVVGTLSALLIGGFFAAKILPYAGNSLSKLLNNQQVIAQKLEKVLQELNDIPVDVKEQISGVLENIKSEEDDLLKDLRLVKNQMSQMPTVGMILMYAKNNLEEAVNKGYRALNVEESEPYKAFLKKIDQNIIWLQELRPLFPFNRALHIYLGRLFRLKKEFKEAIDVLNVFVNNFESKKDNDPTTFETQTIGAALYNIGCYYTLLGEYTNDTECLTHAIENFKKSYKYDPILELYKTDNDLDFLRETYPNYMDLIKN